MSELKICRICLRTESKVYNYEQFQLKSYYEEIIALKVSETDELPHYFCFECATLLHRFHKFKEKCYTGQILLKELLRKGPAGMIELSKFSSKTTHQESEVENPFSETDSNVGELPVLNNEFNTDPVEIDSFLLKNIDVVLDDESMIENAPLSKIYDETPKPTIELDRDLSKNIETNLNFGEVTENDQLPVDVCDLPSINETLLESDLGYEEIGSNLTENLEGFDENESSMLYGDLPSISQAFDDSNLEFIESDLDLSPEIDIDANLVSNGDLPNTSQEPVIELYNIETGLDLTKKNNADNTVEEKEKLSTNDYHDSVRKSQAFSETITSTLNTAENNLQLSHKNAEELIVNEATPIYFNDGSKAFECNVGQTKSCSINKNLDNKVRITSKNQVAPNIHSVLATISQEYFETIPDTNIGNIDTEDSLNQLQVEQERVEGPIKKKRIRIRRKQPFSKQVKPNPCHKKCGNECSVRLTEVDRLIIHERYWKMSKTEQQDWLLSCIRPKKIRRRQGTTCAKNISYDYYITHNGEDIKVCQQFLMKTLDVSQMRFRYVISKHIANEQYESDISYEAIYKLDRTKLQSPLAKLNLKHTLKVYSTEDNLPIKEEQAQYDQTKVENIEFFDLREDDVYLASDPETDSELKSRIIQGKIGEINNESYKTEIEILEDDFDDKDKDKYTFKRSKLLNIKYWGKKKLSEDEALKEFRKKAESEKYIIAAHKCTDCFKGFSKEDMLKRHRKLRHNKSGSIECRFCRMRFKRNYQLKKHMRQHYNRYECLRCGLICTLENTALLHDIYHSGFTKKCVHCNEEFRHSSTYYTHLRTHRSDHICTHCGSSFVSEMGLRLHKRVKHCFNDDNDEEENEVESPGDDEEVDTYCSRCDIRFETRKAYDEHVFHSAMHTVGDDVDKNPQDPKPRKILGKLLKAKITSRLKEEKSDAEIFQPQKRKLRRLRRARTKPTTCHQCGKHFETQAACMKHHLSDHPGTSFFAPNERHICEICGASLAPGSVTAHQNMHTRERLHSCETCGKQFHSSVGLKRHSVTHTGEKPYGCTLCDKRFTQNNSMKLHYKTFHLMQPYPKRNRRKKDETSKKEELNVRLAADDSVGSDDNAPLSTSATKPVIEPVSNPVTTTEATVAQSSDNNLEYLTLGYQKYP